MTDNEKDLGGVHLAHFALGRILSQSLVFDSASEEKSLTQAMSLNTGKGCLFVVRAFLCPVKRKTLAVRL